MHFGSGRKLVIWGINAVSGWMMFAFILPSSLRNPWYLLWFDGLEDTSLQIGWSFLLRSLISLKAPKQAEANNRCWNLSSKLKMTKDSIGDMFPLKQMDSLVDSQIVRGKVFDLKTKEKERNCYDFSCK